MQPDLTVTLVDGTRVVVPDDLRRITPYVLLEQGDWFEEEIRFVRAWARPGFRVLDIGASYGIYTLSLARCAGPGGRVWAVEPGADVAAYLTRGIAANGLANVELLPYAIGRADGEGLLTAPYDTERRQLAAAGPGGGQVVTVRTLDRAAQDHGIGQVDFVKIDAEGAEADVLGGGAGFLSRESPLLMLEFKNGSELNEDIFAPLERRGYACYRLVPGLNVLVPFYEAEETDPFLLNLFAAKPDRAAALNAAGFLAAGTPVAAAQPAAPARVLARIGALPYAHEHAARWAAWFERAPREAHTRGYAEALGWHALAHDVAAAPDLRVEALERAYALLAEASASGVAPAVLASFVRVAAESGRRKEAMQAGKRLLPLARQQAGDAFAMPLLAPHPYQDGVAPADDPAAWLLWSTIEYLETGRAYSSYFSSKLVHRGTGLALDLRYASAALQRREELTAKLPPAAQ